MATELSPLRAARAKPVDRAERARFAASRRADATGDDEVADTTGDDAAYDPADDNIAGVLKFVEDHEGSAVAVAALERAGKARVTLLAALDEIIEAEAAAEAADNEGDDD